MVVVVGPGLAGRLCTGTMVDYVVHRVLGEDWILGGAG